MTTETGIPLLKRHGRSSSALFLLTAVAVWSLFFVVQERSTFTYITPAAKEGPTFSSRINYSSNNSTTNDTIHVLLGICGNESGFLQEFQVALKNILLQAPLQSAMHIHVMADQDAYDAITSDTDNSDPLHLVIPSLHHQWWSIQPIQLHIYNVQNQLDHTWTTFLQQQFQSFTFELMTSRHTVGAFFRLLAHDTLLQHDPTIQYVIYMDPDVVFLTNIQAVWNERPLANQNILFAWGASMCSGFMLINIPLLPEFWNLTAAVYLSQIAIDYRQAPNDQLFLRAVNVTFPHRVALLSPAWDIHIADGIWRYATTIVQHRPAIGMMHFNGGIPSKEPYFRGHDFLTQPALVETWGVALYYVRMPWTWARFVASSQIPANGPAYPLELFLYPGNND